METSRVLQRTVVLTVCLIGSSQAFGQGATTSLYGKWTLDRKATIEAVKAALAAKGESTDEVDFLPEDLTITLEFTSDQKLHIVTTTVGATPDDVESQHGRWKVLEEMPGKVKLELAMEDESPDNSDLAIQFLDKDRMRLVVNEVDEVLVLRRLRPEP